MYELHIALWYVLALYSQTMTRKLPDQPQNALFVKIPTDEWVEVKTKQLMTSQKLDLRTKVTVFMFLKKKERQKCRLVKIK